MRNWRWTHVAEFSDDGRGNHCRSWQLRALDKIVPVGDAGMVGEPTRKCTVPARSPRAVIVPDEAYHVVVIGCGHSERVEYRAQAPRDAIYLNPYLRTQVEVFGQGRVVIIDNYEQLGNRIGLLPRLEQGTYAAWPASRW